MSAFLNFSKSLQQFNQIFDQQQQQLTVFANNLFILISMEFMPIRQMYKVANKIPDYGIDGYYFQNKYQDPRKIIQDRIFSKQAKGKKNSKYVVKRGNYLDDFSKQFKNNPGPGQYKEKDKWSTKRIRTIQVPKHKKTFLQQITSHSKRMNQPGPGKYNVTKTIEENQKQVKKLKTKKIKTAQKINYLDQVQYVADISPGPGSYNPHQFIKKLHVERRKPEEFRKKNLESQKKQPPKMPDPATYNPIPVNIQTFESLKMKKAIKRPYWGKQERIKNDKIKSKSTTDKEMPGPGKYNIMAQWFKKDKQGKYKANKLQLESKLTEKSIYY